MAAFACHVMPGGKRKKTDRDPIAAADWKADLAAAEAEAAAAGVPLAGAQIFLAGPGGYVRLFDAAGLAWLEAAAASRRIIVHTPFSPQVWAADPGLAAAARKYVGASLHACAGLGVEGVVLHLPDAPPDKVAHGVRACVEDARRRAANAVCGRRALRGRARGCTLFLETAATSPTHKYATARDVGALVRALDAVRLLGKVGLCFDTAHLHATGEDIGEAARARAFLDGVTRELARTGVRPKVLLHLNDNKTPLGSLHDQHMAIGEGEIWKGNPAGARDWIAFAQRERGVIVLERKRDMLATDYARIREMTVGVPAAANTPARVSAGNPAADAPASANPESRATACCARPRALPT